MKLIVLSFLINGLLAARVTLFEDIHYEGDSTTLNVDESCQNVERHWNDRTSSVKTDSCIRLFEHIDCGGRSIDLQSDSDNLVEVGFNDEMTSLKACSDDGGEGGGEEGDSPSRLCVAETNAKRAENGMRPLKPNKYLEKAAYDHTEKIVREKCFPPKSNPHQCPGEPGFPDRAKKAGYNFRLGGENIADGATSCKSALDGLMESKGHRANILNKDVRDMGCGRFNNVWTCMYGSDKI